MWENKLGLMILLLFGMCNLENSELSKEKQKMKTDYDILERKLKELKLETKLQNEELQKVNREKTAVDSQRKESEKLMFQEKEKVVNLEKELLKLKEDLQAKNVQLDEYKLSMTDVFEK